MYLDTCEMEREAARGEITHLKEVIDEHNSEFVDYHSSKQNLLEKLAELRQQIEIVNSHPSIINGSAELKATKFETSNKFIPKLPSHS
jgi:hypothetical protein